MQKQTYDVVIVGAGIAGLGAAHYLKMHGKAVLVLEGQERLGGRILTERIDTPSGQMSVELGAEWIGKEHKALLSLCRELNLEVEEHREAQSYLLNGNYFSEGQLHFDQTWMQKMRGILLHLNNYATDEELKELDKTDFETFLLKHGIPKRDLEILRLQIGTMMGVELSKISAYSGACSAMTLDLLDTNGDDLIVKGGNDRIIQSLARRVGEQNIYLKSPVASIHQDSSGVVVKTARGGTYRAKSTVVAVPPQRVLDIKFDSKLPDDLRKALLQIHYAHVTKASFIFSQRKWKPKDVNYFTDTELCQVYDSTSSQQTDWAAINSYTFGTYQKKFLHLSEQWQVRLLAKALKLPVGTLDHYEQRLIKVWDRDVWAGGAYAYYQPNQWFRFRSALSQSHGLVHFAGEHLADNDNQGYMNGALETGYGVGRKIVRRWKVEER